jgi:uncharacterized protein (DUF4213/DUF364 family)
MKTINENLIESLLPGKILAVQVGPNRTAVLAETDAGIRCGLAATLSNPEFDHKLHPSVREAGDLHKLNPIDLAGLVESHSFTEVAIGLATINALLPQSPNQWADIHAEEYLVEHGANKNVVVVGHFPFIDRLKLVAKNLWVLELNPKEGDLPAEAAPEVVPQADVVAITATTLINKTFQGLIELCQSQARVVLVGPSTPLSPIMYDYGIDVLSGTIVTNPHEVLTGIGQGISFHQLRQKKVVRLVTLQKGIPQSLL